MHLVAYRVDDHLDVRIAGDTSRGEVILPCTWHNPWQPVRDGSTTAKKPSTTLRPRRSRNLLSHRIRRPLAVAVESVVRPRAAGRPGIGILLRPQSVDAANLKPGRDWRARDVDMHTDIVNVVNLNIWLYQVRCV